MIHVRFFVLVNPDAHDDPDGQHIDDERCTAITNKGQRDAGNWHDAKQHPDIFEDLKHEHRYNPNNNVRAKEGRALYRRDDHSI